MMTLHPTRPMVLGMTPMNAPTANDQFGFSLGDLTYINSTYDDEAASRSSGCESTICSLV